MKKKLVVVILSYNESIHIERAINNVLGWADKVIVLDSYSEDDTAKKAESLGAEVIFRKFDNYKNQREYAIEYSKNQTEWLFFLDADEYLTDDLKVEIKNAIMNIGVDGYYMAIRFIFMNRWIRWGGYYPTYFMRLFRPEQATLRGIVNEHVKIMGNTQYLKNEFIDHNLKGINYWIDKHNRYATLEARALLDFKSNNMEPINVRLFSGQTERKQWLRYKVWNKLPLVIRPFIYFIYRYFFKLGFLDGKEGFVYHFLQGFWFWLLIDIKYVELKNKK